MPKNFNESHFTVIQPKGILDSIHITKLRRDIIALSEHKTKLILLDLQEITDADIYSLQTLVTTLKVVRAKGGELALCSISDRVRSTFELSRMDLIFQIYSSSQEFEKLYFKKKKALSYA